MRDWLKWKRSDFVEYDVEAVPAARTAEARLHHPGVISYPTMASASSIHVRGIVQGVGFRPFVYRLARAYSLNGWVRNGEAGVEIHVEGVEAKIADFLRDLKATAPAAASVAEIEAKPVAAVGWKEFTIRESDQREPPTARISPDLPVCEECLRELFDARDPRYFYPYINCTNCGPRYTVVKSLPYDRPNTTMQAWPLDEFCGREYRDPANRRFHAQPVACPNCGPNYYFHPRDIQAQNPGDIHRAAEMLSAGKILAIKGLGGYHLACDARSSAAVNALRERKYRKEKPFALMVVDLVTARTLVDLSGAAEELLTSMARPIVLAPAKVELPGVAPNTVDLGVMLPYTPLHHLLFAAGAPRILVMTSANRSSEPIAYEDEDAVHRLSEIADAIFVGERPIARRVDDSVARAGALGPQILRRSRGYAPGAVASIPVGRPILALGADLKNSITLVVEGQAFVSQYIGDLDHLDSLRAFRETVDDLLSMYKVRRDELLLVHDLHPGYFSSIEAGKMRISDTHPVQHHRAHVASVLAERCEWAKRVAAVSFDGTGFGDDGTIWGGEIFVGSVQHGFERVAHLRPAVLPGGDAAARHPVQASAGFLAQIDSLPDLLAAPFNFPGRYRSALELVGKGVRSFATTSVGRLFDAVAALLGFTRPITFEGQAAMWVEQLARGSKSQRPYPFPYTSGQLDFRPLLAAAAQDRVRGLGVAEIARSFQRGLSEGLFDAVKEIARMHGLDAVVLSGGVFQNDLLLEDLKSLLAKESLELWTNRAVPANDGGISLGQAALAAFGCFDSVRSSTKRSNEFIHA